MKIYHNIDEFVPVKNAVITTGTFDGVHLGHKKIIERLNETARREKGESVILTFHPHPRMVLYPDDNDLKMLNTQEEKIALLEKAGVDHLVIHPFTKKFSRTTSIAFVRDILVNKLQAGKLVIGYNHHFGRNREGTFRHLKEYGSIYGFKVEEIPARDIDRVEISSTKIRKALLKGDIDTANKFLGYPYSLSGTVVKGKGLGKPLGYPTANIEVKDKYKLVPADGIYAAITEVEGKLHKGMMSIGMNPTVNGTKRSIEIHIFNFGNDIYGQLIRINFVKRLRKEEKFDNLEKLKKQMDKDKELSEKILARTK